MHITTILCLFQTVPSINNRFQTANTTVGMGPRIAPPNSALVSTARQIRDPRLLRQQQKQSNVVNSNVQLESKPQMDSNNKIVNNKMSVRDNRTEPHLINNKDDSTLPSDKVKSVSRLLPKSRSKHLDSARKAVKASRISKSSNSDSKGDSSKSSSTSSLDSPTKTKSDKKLQSTVKSPTKIKKKDVFSADKKVLKSPVKSDISKLHKSDLSPTFKDIKVSMKNRNYMRRNRKTSISPEPTQDVDLRINGPPEKQPRLQSEPPEDKSKIFEFVDKLGCSVQLSVSFTHLFTALHSCGSNLSFRSLLKHYLFDVLLCEVTNKLSVCPTQHFFYFLYHNSFK